MQHPAQSKLTMLAVLIAGLVVFDAAIVRAQDLWTEDLPEAKTRAAKEGKDILMDFTGSDWCPVCVELHKDVFNTAQFKKDAPKSFVLVELDYPENKPQSDRVKQQNAELAQMFDITAFPALVLMDSRGEPYARINYDGVPETMLPRILGLHERKAQRDLQLEKAGKAIGIEKAMLLDDVVKSEVDGEILMGLDAILEQIVALDADNKAGLKEKYEMRVELHAIISIAEAGDTDGAIAKLDALLSNKKETPLRKQEFLYQKAILLQSKSQAAAHAALKAAQDQDPSSKRGKEIAGILADLGHN